MSTARTVLLAAAALLFAVAAALLIANRVHRSGNPHGDDGADRDAVRDRFDGAIIAVVLGVLLVMIATVM